MNRAKVNFWVDVVLFVVLILVLMSEETGTNGHQVLGIVLAAGITVHLALHWRWITTTIRRWSRSLPRRARRHAVIDALLLVAFAWTLVSGLAISPLSWGNQASVHSIELHHAGAGFTFLMISIHLLLHRKWIGSGIKRHILGVYPFDSPSVRKPSPR